MFSWGNKEIVVGEVSLRDANLNFTYKGKPYTYFIKGEVINHGNRNYTVTNCHSQAEELLNNSNFLITDNEIIPINKIEDINIVCTDFYKVDLVETVEGIKYAVYTLMYIFGSILILGPGLYYLLKFLERFN